MEKVLFETGSYSLVKEGAFYRLLRRGSPIYTGKDFELAKRWFQKFVDMERSGL